MSIFCITLRTVILCSLKIDTSSFLCAKLQTERKPSLNIVITWSALSFADLEQG